MGHRRLPRFRGVRGSGVGKGGESDCKGLLKQNGIQIEKEQSKNSCMSLMRNSKHKGIGKKDGGITRVKHTGDLKKLKKSGLGKAGRVGRKLQAC